MVLKDSDGGGEYLPPDLELNAADAAASAALITKDSYDVTLKLPLTRSDKIYQFWFNYVYQDPETKLTTEGPRSPIVEHGFDIPNLTKGVQGLTLTAGFKSYGVKFTIDPTSVQEDVVIFESLTPDFANQYIVYVGNSTNVSINTSNFAPRWVKVRSRDKWLTQNNTDVIAVGPDANGSVIPKNADPDTSTPPSPPSSGSAVGSIDVNDKSGFSGKMTVSWTANTDTNTSGYVIRWSAQDPSVVTNPLWEYGQVDGKATTTFEITGLTPNTRYYWQLTAKSPYNAISWASPRSGTINPIIDSNAPADVFAQLRSVLSIGGKNADLFKIGTGISQDINTSITTTPSFTTGTYNGIILDRSSTNYGHNYWLNTGQFRVGSATSFLFWSGSDLYTTGKINATGGSFTGDVQLNGGSLFAGSQANTGARVRLNSSGLFAYDANNAQTVAITQADGKIDARQGYIGGWTINASGPTTGKISNSNTVIDSSGYIQLGDTGASLNSIVKLSATDTYRIWVGSQSSSAAKFKVHSNGTLYATGAVIDGTTSISGTVTIGGTAASTVVSNASLGATALQSNGTFNGTIGTSATINGTNLNTRLTDAYTASQAALPKSGFNRAEIVKYINSTTSNPTNTTSIDGGTIITGTISAQAVVADFIGAFSINADKITSGTLSGRAISGGSINISGGSGSATNDDDGNPSTVISTTQNAFSTLYNRSNISCVGFNAMAFISVNTGGWVSSLYPYTDGAVDLGVKSSSSYSTYRWRNLRLTNAAYFGGDGSTNTPGTGTANPKIAIFGNGSLFADSLNSQGTATGGSTGTAIIQNSSGYLKVSGSSRKFKENIYSLSKDGYLDALMLVNPVNFNYIGEDEIVSGLIAEELDEIEKFKGVVNYDLEGDPISIAYDRMSALLVLAIKEIKDKIDGIKQRLDALEG